MHYECFNTESKTVLKDMIIKQAVLKIVPPLETVPLARVFVSTLLAVSVHKGQSGRQLFLLYSAPLEETC
jgi:hypothetical protein